VNEVHNLLTVTKVSIPEAGDRFGRAGCGFLECETFRFFLNHFGLYSNLMNEKELVRKAQAGDFGAFSELVNMHKTKLYNLAVRMTGNELDAEDVVQETLLKAIDKIDQFRGEASFGTWLYSIALNQTRASLNKEKRTDLRPVEDYLPMQGDHSHDSVGSMGGILDWKDPHQLLERSELRRIINEAIGTLPVEYREAFLLRYIEELPIKEVAKLIGETVAATKSRVLRARLAVRDYLAKVFEVRYGQEMR